MKKLMICLILIWMTGCNLFSKPSISYTFSRDCGFYRIVRLQEQEKSALTRESKEILASNNIDACKSCPNFRDLEFCKFNKKDKQMTNKIKKKITKSKYSAKKKVEVKIKKVELKKRNSLKKLSYIGLVLVALITFLLRGKKYILKKMKK